MGGFGEMSEKEQDPDRTSRNCHARARRTAARGASRGGHACAGLCVVSFEKPADRRMFLKPDRNDPYNDFPGQEVAASSVLHRGTIFRVESLYCASMRSTNFDNHPDRLVDNLVGSRGVADAF